MTEQEAINVFKGFKFTPREMKAVAMGIEALEKQIPKEIEQFIVDGKMSRRCSNGCDITGVTMWATLNYCPYCGQAIK